MLSDDSLEMSVVVYEFQVNLKGKVLRIFILFIRRGGDEMCGPCNR